MRQVVHLALYFILISLYSCSEGGTMEMALTKGSSSKPQKLEEQKNNIRVFPEDEFGIGVGGNNIVGLLQIKNDLDTPIYFNNFKSGFSVFIPLLFNNYKYPIPPHKSIIVHYRSQLKKTLLDDQMGVNVNIYYNAYCGVEKNNTHALENNFRGKIKMKGNSIVRSCSDTQQDLFFKGRESNIHLPRKNDNTIKISSSEEFGFFITKRKLKIKAEKKKLVVEGFIKLTNLSNLSYKVENVGSDVSMNSISSYFKNCYIPPKKSILLEYQSNLIEELYAGDLDLFFKEKIKLDYWVEFSNGKQKYRMPFSIQLSKNDLNYIIE